MTGNLPAKIQNIKDMGGRAIARASNPQEAGHVYDRLKDAQDIIAAVTKDRNKINTIADPMIEAAVKAGRMLIKMTEDGDRPIGRPKVVHDDALTNPLTNKELGFSPSRARRWQLAAKLPDNLREDCKEKVLAQPDGILSLAAVIKAAKLYLGKQEQVENIEPTDATIVLGDCKKWLRDQPQCNLLLTDPPYSTDIDDIAAFASSWVPTALDKVLPTGRAYICIGAYPHELHAYLSVPTPKHLQLSQVLVWTYRNRVGPSPVTEYKLNWQAIIYYCGVDAPPLNCSRAVSDYPDLNEQFSVQDINLPDARRFESWHAWQKPDELCERFVRHASQPGDLILDPFAGTGSFLLAAARLGRVARGCDKSEEMVSIAKKRGCK